MALFKNKSSMYQDDYEIKQRMEEDDRNFSAANTSFQEQAQLDIQQYSGDQFSDNSYNYGDALTRKFVFNLTRRFVEMPAGYYMQHEKSLIAIPRENGAQETADLFSKVFSFIEGSSGLQQVLVDAFTFGTLVTGFNLIEMYMDYTDDPVSGDIKFDRVSQAAIVIDPFFRKLDLSDCSSIRKRTYVTKAQAKMLLPDYANDIKHMTGTDNRDGKFQFMPENYSFDTSSLLAYDSYCYMDSREQRIILDKNTGDKTEWIGSDEALRYVMQGGDDGNGDDLETYVQTIPSVKEGILLEENLFYSGRTLLGTDSYPYFPMMGYFSPDLKESEFKMQGLVRGLRDPQFLFNHRQTISLDTLESRSTSGYMAVEGSVVDPESLYKTGQGQVIWRKKGSDPTDVVPIQPTDISDGMAKMTGDMSDLLKMVSGIPDEALGQSTDDIPGILAMMRQGQALTVIHRLFYNADRCLELIGKKMLEVIQKKYIPSKVQRITAKEVTPEFYNKNFGKYDVVVEEGFKTSTQRQQQFAQAIQMKQLGIELPELDTVIIESSTLQNKTDLINAMKQSQQAEKQQQQQEATINAQEQQAGIKMAEAQANYQNKGADERESRIPENLRKAEENAAQAHRDEEQALLNKAKALKELQAIDFDSLEKVVRLAKLLKDDEQEQDKNFISNLGEINKIFGAEEPPTPSLK